MYLFYLYTTLLYKFSLKNTSRNSNSTYKYENTFVPSFYMILYCVIHGKYCSIFVECYYIA